MAAGSSSIEFSHARDLFLCFKEMNRIHDIEEIRLSILFERVVPFPVDSDAMLPQVAFTTLAYGCLSKGEVEKIEKCKALACRILGKEAFEECYSVRDQIINKEIDVSCSEPDEERAFNELKREIADRLEADSDEEIGTLVTGVEKWIPSSIEGESVFKRMKTYKERLLEILRGADLRQGRDYTVPELGSEIRIQQQRFEELDLWKYRDAVIALPFDRYDA